MAEDKDFSKEKKQGAVSKLHGVSSFIWNGETHEFLGRTGKSWLLIGIYYLIFYSCLAGFFAVNLLVFFVGISDTEPKLQNKDTILKGYPGMGFRPMVEDADTLIHYSLSDQKTIDKLVKTVDEFLEPYSAEAQNNPIYQNCSNGEGPAEGKLCRFDLSSLGECTKANNYGYDKKRPCVFLKLNKVFGWVPEPFNNDTCTPEKQLETGCPTTVAPNHIAVTCEGESDADKQYMNTTKFFPEGGFSFSYYPYANKKGYLAPLVAVQFQNPQEYTLLMIWCKAWANNIYHHKNDRAGSVHFELLVDL